MRAPAMIGRHDSHVTQGVLAFCGSSIVAPTNGLSSSSLGSAPA
ncbi:hypothetical protein KYC5002_35785 [Archangium violaceum]|nr:hypothetical protein KYC5002_35785 [Archangium gephyra]